MRRRLRPLALVLLAAAGVAALATFGLASGGSSAKRLAPPLPSERLAGVRMTLSSLLAGTHGRAAVVVFWASWCGPCAQEAAAIERFSQGPTGSGRVVGVDWSDALSGARAFIRTHAWTFPNLRDSEGTVGNRYRLTGLPTTFVVDSQGRIGAALRGPQSEHSLEAALRAAEAT